MTDLNPFDLDAHRRESQFPDGVPLTFKGDTWTLPAELPAEALDPLLSDDLDLMGLIRDVLRAREPKTGDVDDIQIDTQPEQTFSNDVIDALFARKNLPKQVLGAVKDVLRVIFGDAEFDRFVAAGPSVPDYIRIARGLANLYAVSLGEAFGSLVSFGTGGGTLKQTSNGSTGSTPEPSGDTQEPPAAISESAA